MPGHPALGSIGQNAVADLNVKKADQGKQMKKFERGYGRYWQCQQCGELHDDSLMKCVPLCASAEIAVLRTRCSQVHH